MSARLVNALRGVRQWVRVVWFMALGGFLLFEPNRRGGTRGVLLRLILGVVRFCVFWALIWIVIWRLDPTLLVGSRSGLQTVFQVLPATTVALLVLVLGSLFVVVQIVVQLWGTRSPVMVGLDEQVQGLVAQPLIVVSAALILAGQVPDSGKPSTAVTAGAAVLAFATVRIFYRAAFALPSLTQRYTLPRGFPQYVIQDIDREFESTQLGLVVMRVPLLTEMLRLAIARGDNVAVGHILEALTLFHERYLAAVAANPALRSYHNDDPHDPTHRKMWFAQDLVSGLVAAVEDGLHRGESAVDLNGVAHLAGGAATKSIRAGERDDASKAIDALVEMGTLTQQASPYINLFSEPAWQLAFIEATAEEHGDDHVATAALAGWTMLVSYPAWHLRIDQPHPLIRRSLETFGPSPPWLEVPGLLQSDAWLHKWANKLYYGPTIVMLFLPMLAEGFDVRDDPDAYAAWWDTLGEFVSGVVHGPPDEVGEATSP